MSAMVLYEVQANGDVVERFELRNAWRGAALVWTELGKKYRHVIARHIEPTCKKDPHDFAGWGLTWKLARRPEITDAEWFTLCATFDRVLIPQEHLAYAADCFEKFGDEFGGHWSECAQATRVLVDEKKHGLAFNHTTVSRSHWIISDDEDSCRPYNVNQDEDHWILSPGLRAEELSKASAAKGVEQP